MQSYQFFDTVVLRAPAFSYQLYAGVDTARMLSNPAFTEALRQASPVVFEQLIKCGMDAGAMSQKLRKTVRRYYNRMCHRPTPFATMATLSIGSFSNHPAQLVLSDQQVAHKGPEFKVIIRHFLETTKKLAQQDSVIANPSLYRLDTEWRYLQYKNDANDKKRAFSIASISMTDAILQVLDYTQKAVTAAALTTSLATIFNAPADTIYEFLAALVDKQILLPAGYPGVTGFTNIRSGNKAVDHSNDSYIIAERTLQSGAFDKAWQGPLLEALRAGHRLMAGSTASSSMAAFKTAFRRKFDMRLVPLLFALDPETGVGYQDLANAVTQDAFVQNLPEIKNKPAATTIEWNAAHTYLMSKWTEAVTSGVLKLDSDEVAALDISPASIPLAPTISILGRIKDDTFFIESAGGVSALPLLGRFTVLGDAYANFAREIAHTEARYNPDILFAEIVHVSEYHTANIERRIAARAYEIPVMTGAGVDRAYQVNLSDLYIKLENDTIILWSERLQKRIIPRLSSAFNYQRSDLSVYRFLCDLQREEISSNFIPSLRQYFPGQRFYPRLQINNIVLQPATWLIPAKEKQAILESTKDKLDAIAGWLRDNKCPRYISVTEHDNQIVIDTTTTEGLETLLDFFEEDKQLMILEFPFTEQETPVIQDTQGRGYINQVLFSLYNTEAAYEAPKGQVFMTKGAVPRQRTPGTEWLYYKLYCLPMRANEILLRNINPLVTFLREQQFIERYFFMRFTEDGFHIRLRFQLRDTSKAGSVMQYVHEGLQPLIAQMLISKIQLDTYERELERYSEEVMLQAEQFFCSSSDMILYHLLHTCSDTTDLRYYQAGFAGVILVYDAFRMTMAERIRVSHFFYRAFSKEFNHDPALEQKARDVFRRIGRAYDFENLLLIESEAAAQVRNDLDTIFREKGDLNPKRINQLIGSLVHLHLNRLFTDQPRMQEMIVYYCLWKHYESHVAREKATLSGQLASSR